MESFDTGAAFNAIFQLAAVLTGLLFSIYCFVIVSSNPFIEKVRTTTAYQRSKTYVKNTLYIGIVLTFLSSFATAIKFKADIETGVFILLAVSAAWWFRRFIGCLHRFNILS